MNLFLHTQHYLSKGSRMACTPLLAALMLSATSYAANRETSLATVKNINIKEAARINVTGTVKDSKGEPLPGVSVKIKGTTTGTSTDVNGVFRLNLPTGNETLVFSFLGFTTREVAAKGATSFNITLQESASELNEVVVVGYGTQKKASLTHAVENIKMEAIQDLPVGSLAAALRGQVAGVSVAGGQARPGENARITIRNPSLLSKDGGTTEPIYIIDDVVKTSDQFNLLDVTEIESISVLKDAAAAIYGVSGNNGAVLVRTKRGKVGPPQISYSGSVGTSDALMLPKMMNGYELATYLNDYNIARGQGTSGDIYTPDELEYFKAHNYNWLDMAWKSSMVSRHTLSASGGSDRATYFGSITYNAQDANLENIDASRWTYRASTDIKVTKGLKLGLQVSGDLYNKKMYWLKQGGESVEKDVLALLQTPQFNPPYINGLPVLLGTATNSTTENFHFFEIQNSDNYTKTRNSGLNVNLNLDYEVPFIKGLKARAVYNKREDNSFGKQYGTSYPVYRFSMLGTNKHIYGGDVLNSVILKNGNQVRFNPTYAENYQINGSLNYDRTFGKHTISALAMVEQRESYTDGVATYIEDPMQGGSDNMNYATGVSVLQSESESESGYLSYIGRLNYNYADKYLAEFTLRADASSGFAPENRWGYFPSFSFGWVVSEENFFKNNVRFMNFLKIRGSAGFVGADRTRPFQWYDKYKKETGKGAVFGGDADRTLTIIQDGITNREVVWDDATKLGLGLEARFLKDRLSLTVDGYHDRNYNMLTQLTSSVSALVGQQLPSENYGEMKMFGTEISLGWRDNINTDWKYGINTFFSWNDNKNVKVDVSQGLVGSIQDPNGRSTDMGIWGYRYVGMFRTEEDVTNYLAQHPGYKLFGKDPEPGMLYYEDISGPRLNGNPTDPDGVITEDDVEFLTKKANNHYGLGFNFNVAFKSLSLSVTSGASWGGQDVVEGDARKIAKNTLNRPAFWADHWTPENTDAKYPNPYYTDTYDRVSSFWFRSSTTFNISNINVSYSLPKTVVSRVGLSSARVYLVGTNPFIINNPYSDYRYSTGVYNAYPALKSWSLGLNVGF
ncbi:SusC/RagA family TonB-linked outer membrane protein [Desertivirga xinjiangensis]|uniref:SusC/RagA family TonB-linked outer membrane protein n=1 Tax=Desertivirga xinjiangensis TaxID=539206 RepID=UPI00210D325E|nr:TonB-dependent receptor [Pedobacter xinjiangensis]